MLGKKKQNKKECLPNLKGRIEIYIFRKFEETTHTQKYEKTH